MQSKNTNRLGHEMSLLLISHCVKDKDLLFVLCFRGLSPLILPYHWATMRVALVYLGFGRRLLISLCSRQISHDGDSVLLGEEEINISHLVLSVNVGYPINRLTCTQPQRCAWNLGQVMICDVYKISNFNTI